MYSPQNKGNTRKVFQKPNILRRQPKAKRRVKKYSESPEEMHPLISTHIQEHSAFDQAKINVCVTSNVVPNHEAQVTSVHSAAASHEISQLSEKAEVRTFGISNVNELEMLNVATSELRDPAEEAQDSITNVTNILKDKQNNTFFKPDLFTVKSCALFGQQDNEEEQNSLNIESFLMDSPKKQSEMVPSGSSLTTKKTEAEVDNNKWCLNFMSEDSKDMVTPSFYDEAQISKVNTLNNNPIPFSNETLPSEAHNVLEKDVIQSCLTSKVVKYKCDMPNCNKSFWNEARLQKHKTIHSKQKTTSTPPIVECPVKKVDTAGQEQRCSKVFPSRDTLVKHLNEDHVPEDAGYSCMRCGRRFWWATGLRTHTQSTCTRALLCTWAGCGRVFRQPCRLREHARSHTGDRPYPCTYPNCSWAFRSASKLVRHARQHTGERRHECAACGRAFPRREHLRDHAARHHAPPKPPRLCTHTGCEQTFSSMSLLCQHLKKEHRVDSKSAAPKKQRASKKKPAKNVLVMTLGRDSSLNRNSTEPIYTSITDAIEIANATAMNIPEEELVDNDFTEVVEVGVNQEGVESVPRVEQGVNFGYDLEGRCARTHCTWPLQLTQPEQAFTIEEDTQVEQSESSESNIYTVRSDLFLHGNLLINEDSEFTIREISHRGASEAEEPSTGQLDALDLIDSHPTIDLMQEELMYGDAASDEASFRVFLMNGELS